MAVNTFGVNADSVRAFYFPHSGAFSASTSPTATTVGTMIDESAADLAGRLLKESIVAADIDGTSSSEYLWCARTLRLMVAVSVARASTSQDTGVAKAWEAELKARLEALDEGGATVLGNDALSTAESDPDGPTDHLDEYGIDIGDTSDASSVEPPLRRSDSL